MASMVSSSPLRTPVTHSIVTSSVMSAGWSPTTPQYRGEPRIPVDTTPGAAADASNVRRDEVSPGKCRCSVEAEVVYVYKLVKLNSTQEICSILYAV